MDGAAQVSNPRVPDVSSALGTVKPSGRETVVLGLGPTVMLSSGELGVGVPDATASGANDDVGDGVALVPDGSRVAPFSGVLLADGVGSAGVADPDGVTEVESDGVAAAASDGVSVGVLVGVAGGESDGVPVGVSGAAGTADADGVGVLDGVADPLADGVAVADRAGRVAVVAGATVVGVVEVAACRGAEFSSEEASFLSWE